MSKSYRENIQIKCVTAEEIVDDGLYYTDVILASEVFKIIDNIEDRVDMALNALRDIHGLVEIDNVKEVLGRLSDDLY